MISSPGHRARAEAGVSIVVLLVLLPLACTSETPEQQVRRLIDDAESAVRTRDFGSLAEMVSENYRDANGYGKREVLGLLRYRFQHAGSIHLIKKVRSIRAVDPSRVEAEVLVAAAEVDLREFRDLESVSADMLLFDLEFVRESRRDWRLVSSAWKRAEPADFF